MAIRKTLPMYTAMSELQLRINEAGIPKFQLQLTKAVKTNQRMTMRVLKGESVDNSRNNQEITLKQIGMIFQLWGVSMIFALAVFLTEILWWKTSRIIVT